MIVVGLIGVWLFLGAFVAGYQHHYYEQKKEESSRVRLFYIVGYVLLGGFFIRKIIKNLFK